jgi:thiosulfate reductase cytochrome b subunit
MINNREYFYPLWLRIWHWLNAILFFCLIFSGINLQYSNTASPIINFQNTIQLHNISGIILTINYLFFFIMNLATGNYKQYLPKIKGILKSLSLQIKFYLSGIFKNNIHPFETSKEQKFNPLQQITYLKIMYAVFPLIIISGWALLFPEFIINKIFGIPGLTLTAIFHTSIGFILSVFMVGHIYLASTGTTVFSNFKAMITGWHVGYNDQIHPVKQNIKEVRNESESASIFKN